MEGGVLGICPGEVRIVFKGGEVTAGLELGHTCSVSRRKREGDGMERDVHHAAAAMPMGHRPLGSCVLGAPLNTQAT